MRRIVLAFIFIGLCVNSFAQDAAELKKRETLKEKLIGSLVKTFAKSYVATNNLKKFKEKNIKKIMKMDEVKFQRVYGKIYREMIVDLPESLKQSYGISEQMTRAKAVAQINAFKTKKRIYQMINAIPNKMIAQHLRNHKDEFDKTMKGHTVDGLLDQLLQDPAASNT